MCRKNATPMGIFKIPGGQSCINHKPRLSVFA
jgi:hypothetical protein